MSATSLYACTVDQVMVERTTAITVQQAYDEPTLNGTDFAARVRADPWGLPRTEFIWPVALNCEADYEAGLAAGDGAANVSDAQILAAIQAHWPAEPKEQP